MMQPAQLPLYKIRIDGGTQPRESIDDATVADYAEQLKAGVTFPAAVVFHDGTNYWLADGFHRRAAHAAAGIDEMPVDLRQGKQRDAVLYSVGANADHGIRRTNADKRRAVMRLLDDAEWSKWSDREIARRCGVSHQFVTNLRPSLSTVDSEKPDRTYTTRHGTTATMNTSNIGRKHSSPRYSNEGAQDASGDEQGIAVLDKEEGAASASSWRRLPPNDCFLV